jgi:hypothetical protein
MNEEFQGIDDRIFNEPIYEVESKIVENRLYYIFYKDGEYITVSGEGDDPNNLKNIQWNSSAGAKGIVKQMMKVKSGYSPKFGFVKIEKHPNNLYVQAIRFQTIYKDGWRFNRSNIGDELEKMQSKKRVYVKASKRSKAHYRMQTVGREELAPDVTDIWKIPRDKFLGLISGDQLELKEKYIDEHNYKFNEEHPELQKLLDLMDKDHAEWKKAILRFFSDPEIPPHEQAIFRKLGAHERVPLHVLKDYPEAAYSYEIDISDEALEQEPPRGEITHLTEMTKGEYDAIIEDVKKDYETDPKKITDTMLNQYYADELEDVKRAAKFRKKVFNKIPKAFREGFTPESMNCELHKQVILYLSKSLEIPDDVKAGYPTYFKGVPFTYESTDNKNNNDSINKILAKVRDICGNDLGDIDKVVKKIINSTEETLPIYVRIENHDMEDLVNVAMNDVSKLVGKDLLNKINEFTNKPDNHPIIIDYDPNRTRAYGGKEIMLAHNDINVKQHSYNDEVITHEYGHSIEYMIPEISNAARSFRDRRTEGEKIVRFVDTFPNMGYDEWETTQIDHFMTAYIGKIYPEATEILSTGMAFLTSKESAQRMYENDPEYFGLILAMLSGRIK